MIITIGDDEVLKIEPGTVVRVLSGVVVRETWVFIELQDWNEWLVVVLDGSGDYIYKNWNVESIGEQVRKAVMAGRTLRFWCDNKNKHVMFGNTGV